MHGLYLTFLIIPPGLTLFSVLLVFLCMAMPSACAAHYSHLVVALSCVKIRGGLSRIFFWDFTSKNAGFLIYTSSRRHAGVFWQAHVVSKHRDVAIFFAVSTFPRSSMCRVDSGIVLFRGAHAPGRLQNHSKTIEKTTIL